MPTEFVKAGSPQMVLFAMRGEALLTVISRWPLALSTLLVNVTARVAAFAM
jgi:hypothetical protein